MVVQSPTVVEAVREVLVEVQLADHAFNERLEEAAPFSFDVDRLPVPFGGPTLMLTARQDHLCGYRDAWDLLDTYPRATFAVLDRAGHFVNIEQDALCQALMREWLDRVEEWATDLDPPRYRDTTCCIMGVVARARGERCGTLRRGARVGGVLEFYDRGDKKTKCLALLEVGKRSLVVRRACYEKSPLKRWHPDCLRSVG